MKILEKDGIKTHNCKERRGQIPLFKHLCFQGKDAHREDTICAYCEKPVMVVKK